MVAKNSTIKSAKDLNGKTIAVPGLGTAASFVVFAWLDANGADSSSVKFVELPYSAMPAAIEAGRVDAAHVAEPFVSGAKEHARVFGSADDTLGKQYLRTVWFTRSSWAAAHPDLVAKFVSVMHQTALWANDKRNQAKSAAILVQHAKIDPSLVAAMTRARYGLTLRSRAAAAGDRTQRKIRSLQRVPVERPNLQTLTRRRVEDLRVPRFLKLIERFAPHRRVDVQVRHADDGAQLFQHEEADAVADHALPVAPADEVALLGRQPGILERAFGILEKAGPLRRHDQVVQKLVDAGRSRRSRSSVNG